MDNKYENNNIRRGAAWRLGEMSEVKEYKPVTAEDMNPYILFKTSKFGNIKVRFQKDEDMNAELLILDQLFDVE